MDLSTKLKITAGDGGGAYGGAVDLAGPGLKGDPSRRADRARSVRRAAPGSRQASVRGTRGPNAARQCVAPAFFGQSFAICGLPRKVQGSPLQGPKPLGSASVVH
jgi:hypothetical protein